MSTSPIQNWLRRLAVVLAAPLWGIGVSDAQPLPLFDAHLHYNWEPRPHLPLDAVLKLFRDNRVTGILANSRPNDGTQALVAARSEGLWVLPFVRPYRVRADIGTWFNDPTVLDLIETEFARGGYAGIGEFHLNGAAAAGPIVKKVVDFAVRHDIFLHAHSDEEAVRLILAHAPRARVIWAHSGFSTPPDRVAELLERYPNLVGELSYRGGITNGDGRITLEWRRLFERLPDRFLVGSDTWVPQRWDAYGEIMAGYRKWLDQLPREVAEKIAFRNAEALFQRWRRSD